MGAVTMPDFKASDMQYEDYNKDTELQLKKMYARIQKLNESGRMIILMELQGLEYGAGLNTYAQSVMNFYGIISGIVFFFFFDWFIARQIKKEMQLLKYLRNLKDD
jgi:hypothetical protein